MEDPILNRNLEESRELLTCWMQFRDFIQMAFKEGPNSVTQQVELKFLDLKSHLAILHDGFMNGLRHSQKIGQNILQIVGDCILLKRAASYTDAERQKFEFDWNEAYMLINDQIAALNEEKTRLAAIDERAHKAAKARDVWVQRLQKLSRHPAFKVASTIIVICIVLWAIPAFGLYDYRQLGGMNWSQGMYEKVTNNIVRPYFMKDLEFQRMEAVPKAESKHFPPEGFWAQSIDEAQLKATLKSIPLDNQLALEYEYATGENRNQIAMCLYVLYSKTEDAKEMVSKLQSISSQIPPPLKQNAYLQREANLVLVGFGSSPSIAEHIKTKWKLDPSSPNLF